VVGGSGLYIRALAEGFFEPAISDRRLQNKLKRRAQEEGGAALHAELARVDAASAARLHPNDVHRIVRALEVYYTSGKSLAKFWEQEPSQTPFAFHFIGLSMPRAELYERIDRRVDAMLQQGLMDECRKLLDLGYSPELNALQTVGYQEVFAFLAGRVSEQQMAEEIKQHTRNYAKRQMTWFRKNPNPNWIEISANDSAEKIAPLIVARLERHLI
jgi:tRNA dimethylallyltransferase